MTGSKSTPRDVAVAVVKALRTAGHVAYLAGGCVRDALLGFSPKDYDVATDAHPQRVRELFTRSWYVGESFGVVRVQLADRDRAVEVATFRSEWGYQDGRRPTRVHYSDARTDAQRRDFTINALFEDPLAEDDDKRIIDFVAGQKDLRAKVVRAVGDPQSRLGEDYLRLLRAVRFASRLGFSIEPETERAIRGHAKDLGQISRERIGQELLWMLTPGVPPGTVNTAQGVDGRSEQAIRLIHHLHLDGPTLDEHHTDSPLETVGRLARLVQNPTVASTPESIAEGRGSQTPLRVEYATVLAAWLLDRHFFSGPTSASEVSSPRGGSAGSQAPFIPRLEQFVRRDLQPIVSRWRRSICLSNEHRDALQRLLTLLPVVFSWATLRLAKRKRLMADPHWSQLYCLVTALSDHPLVPQASPVVVSIRGDLIKLSGHDVAPRPWVNGEDLIALGLKPGPDFRRLLDAVYDAQLEGRVTSRDEALRWLEDPP